MCVQVALGFTDLGVVVDTAHTFIADVARIINHPGYRDDSTINDISILGKLQSHFSLRAFLERQSQDLYFTSPSVGDCREPDCSSDH